MHRALVAAGAVVLGALLAGPLACRQLVGITDNPPTDLTSTVCGLPYGTASCASCAAASCCGESMACVADPTCARRAQCVGACKSGDWSCVAGCRVETPALNPTFDAWEACTARRCETPCELQCGILGSGTAPETAAACQACFVSSSTTCAFDRECSSSATCIDWLECFGSCRTPDCQASCTASHDGGSDVVGSATTIYQGTCAEACKYGSDWSCVGSVAWPPVTTMPTTLTGQAVDTYSNAYVSGLDVTICRFADNVCKTPLGQGATDSGGNWKAEVMPGLGTDSFAQVTASASASLNVVPELKFIGYPVSEPQAPFAADNGINLVATRAEYQTYLAPTGVSWDTSQAWVAFVVHDCSLGLARGVQVTLTGSSLQGDACAPAPRYYVNGSAYDFAATATDSQGQGGFVNVPVPGQYTLTATAAGKTFSSGHVFVRPGTRSVLYMYPMPLDAQQ